MKYITKRYTSTDVEIVLHSISTYRPMSAEVIDYISFEDASSVSTDDIAEMYGYDYKHTL